MQTTTGSVLNICLDNPLAQAIEVRVIKVGSLSPHLLEFEAFDYTFSVGESQYCFELLVYNVFEEKDYTLKLRTRHASDLGEHAQLTIQVAGFNQGGDLFTDCDCEEGNLVPLGDFDDPILGEDTGSNMFFSTFGLEQCDPLVQINQNGPGNSPGWMNPPEENGNKLAFLAGLIRETGPGSNPESIYFPLCRAINPGCELQVSFRYRLTTDGDSPSTFYGGGNIQVFGTNTAPCSDELIQMLNCGDEVAGAVCLTPNSNSIGLTGIAVTDYTWTTVDITWVNDTDFPVNYITFANNTLGFEIVPPNVIMGNSIYIDDIEVTSQCDNDITLAAEPTVELCAGSITDIPIELCVSGLGPAPTSVTVQLIMPDPFISVSNGTLIAPQTYEVPVTGWVLNGSCAEAVIALTQVRYVVPKN